MEESAQGGSWWDERMAEHEGVFARMLVQRQEGLGGYSRALLERAVDRWLQVGAPGMTYVSAGILCRSEEMRTVYSYLCGCLITDALILLWQLPSLRLRILRPGPCG